MSLISPTTLPYFILLIIVLIIILIAVVPILLHKPTRWYFLHKLIIAIAIGAWLIGLIVLGILEFALIHVIFGGIGIILLTIIASGGFIAKERNKQDIRKGHIWLGRGIVFVLMIYIILVILLPI